LVEPRIGALVQSWVGLWYLWRGRETAGEGLTKLFLAFLCCRSSMRCGAGRRWLARLLARLPMLTSLWMFPVRPPVLRARRAFHPAALAVPAPPLCFHLQFVLISNASPRCPTWRTETQ